MKYRSLKHETVTGRPTILEATSAILTGESVNRPKWSENLNLVISAGTSQTQR